MPHITNVPAANGVINSTAVGDGIDRNCTMLPTKDTVNSVIDDVSLLDSKADGTYADGSAGAAERQQLVSADSCEPKCKLEVRVSRPAYTQMDFDTQYSYERPEQVTFINHFKTALCTCVPSAPCVLRMVYSLFPFFRILRGYSLRHDFVSDLVAGVTVGVMHIPQGMAYGMLSNTDPVYGLYVSFFPPLIYFLFGTSRHISLGTIAIVSLMIGNAVNKAGCAPTQSTHNTTLDTDVYGNLSAYVTASSSSLQTTNRFLLDVNTTDWLNVNSTQSESIGDEYHEVLMCKLGVATATTLLVGLYQLMMGLLRMGFVTIYLSDPLTRAFTTGASIHVVCAQLSHVFGVTLGRYAGALKLIYVLKDFFLGITRTNVSALIMSVVCMVIIYCVQRWISPRFKAKTRLPFPIELVVIIICTTISYLCQFSSRHGFRIKVVGQIQTGIPLPQLPPVWRLSSVAVDAIGIAIVAFTINISLAKLFAKKHHYALDSNQVAGLVSCCFLLVVLLALGPLFHDLPNNVLAAIILVNLRSIFLQITDLRSLYHISIYDMLIWLVTFMAVILTDVDYGLYIGLAFSLLTVVFRTQRAYTCILGRGPGTDVYLDIKSYPTARELHGMKIFRMSAPLYYANCDRFVHQLHRKTGVDPIMVKAERDRTRLLLQRETRKRAKSNTSTAPDMISGSLLYAISDGGKLTSSSQSDIKDIIIDLSQVTFVDAVGAAMLGQVIADYVDIGIRVALTASRDDVSEVLTKAGVFKKLDGDIVYLTIHDAVLTAIDRDPFLLQQAKQDMNSILGSTANITKAADT